MFDSSAAPTSSMGSAPMGAGPSISGQGLGGMQPPGGASTPLPNQQSFNFNQAGGLMPQSGSRHFMMRRNPLRQTQVGRFNSRPPAGLADTAGIQAMQAKLGLDFSVNSKAKSALAASKRASKSAALSPAIAGQNTSALGMSLGLPPMNPQQPPGQPPATAMPPAPPMQPGMPQTPGMQAPMPPQDPNAMPAPPQGGAMGGAPGSMPPAPSTPSTPPMPGDPPPVTQNNGNLVSGLAAQQEMIDEVDPVAASDEIAIEAAPGLETGMPKIGSNPGLKAAQFALPEFKGKKLIRDPYIEKLDKLKKQGSITDFAHAFFTRCVERGVSVKEASLKFAKTFGEEAREGMAELSEAMLKVGESPGERFTPAEKAKNNDLFDNALHNPNAMVGLALPLDMTKSDPNRSFSQSYMQTGKVAALLTEDELRALGCKAAERKEPGQWFVVPEKKASIGSLVTRLAQMPGRVVRGLKNIKSQTIVPRPTEAILAHPVPREFSHLPVGSAVPGVRPRVRRAFGSVPTPTVPTMEDHAHGVGALLGGVPTAMAGTALLSKNSSDMGSDANMTMGMSPSHSYNRPAATTQTAAAPGMKTGWDNSDSAMAGGAGLASAGLGANAAGNSLATSLGKGIGAKPSGVLGSVMNHFNHLDNPNPHIGDFLGMVEAKNPLQAKDVSWSGKDVDLRGKAPSPGRMAYELNRDYAKYRGVAKANVSQILERLGPIAGLGDRLRRVGRYGVLGGLGLAGLGALSTLRTPKKTASMWQKAIQMGRQFAGGAASKAKGFLNAAPKTYQAAVGTPPRTWGQFGKSMFQGDKVAPHGWMSGSSAGQQIVDRGLGAAQGAFTAGSLAGQTPIDPVTGQPIPGTESTMPWKTLGALYGGLTGMSGSRGPRWAAGLHRPMQHSFAGGALGEAADAAVGAFGGQSDFGTLGARLGIGSGLLSNAGRAHRVWARGSGMEAAPWARVTGQLDSALQAGAQGTIAPGAWGLNKMIGGANKVLGGNYIPRVPGSNFTPTATGNNRLNRALFGMGAAGTAVPLAAGTVGAGMGMLEDRIQGAVDNATQRGLDQAGQWAQQRGLLDQSGQFNPMHVGGIAVDRMIQSMGLDPSQMSTADKWALLGGGAAGGLGVLTGNPLLAAGGLGAMGYGGRNGLMELLGHAARFSTGKNVNPHVMAAMTPQDVRLTGQGW